MLLNDLSEGVIGVSSEGDVTIANPAAATLLGRADARRRAARRRSCRPTSPRRWRDSQEDADDRIIVFDHDARTLEATIYPVADEADVPDIVVLRDVTAQARLERARRDLIANASHEFKTPLFSLAGFLELIDEGDLDAEDREGVPAR